MKSRLRRTVEEGERLQGQRNLQPDTKKNLILTKKTKPGTFSPGFFMPVVDKHLHRPYYERAVVLKTKRKNFGIAAVNL
jgi:hypothetical protein